MIGEFFKILFPTMASELEKPRWIKSFFSLFFWISFLTFYIGCVVHQSKISLYPGWTHLNSWCLLGLYWNLVQLWSKDLPNFQNTVPKAKEASYQEVDPKVASLSHFQFFGSSRGKDHRVLKCNLYSNLIKSHKDGVDPLSEHFIFLIVRSNTKTCKMLKELNN